MAAEVLPAEEAAKGGAAATLAPAERFRILIAAGAVMLLVQFALPAGPFLGFPLLFFLKNRLHLTAQQLSIFNLVTAIPLFLSFAFGFLRDRISPGGGRDRALLVVSGLATAGLFAGEALLPPGYMALLGGVFLLNAGVQVAWGATQGLSSELAHEHAMPGQTSTAIGLSGLVPGILAFALGGMLADVLEGWSGVLAARILFSCGGALMLAVAAFSALGPRRLFPKAPPMAEHAHSPWDDVVRLAKHKPIYAPLIIQLLWQFAPAGGVALQYHLANKLHASDSQVGFWYAAFYALVLPSMAAYGWLCQRIRLRSLLFWGTLVAVPQWAPILFAHDMTGAYLATIPIGLVASVPQVAFMDVTIRACPPRLQGTMMMLLWSMFWIAGRVGDVWGAWLYDQKGGFTTAAWATVAVYALILPMLLFIPRRLTATMDGEAIAA